MRALLGHYPVTRAVWERRVQSPLVELAFADVPVPNKAFKRVVRDVEFDVAELALMTFLMARSRGVPLRLLPVALFSRNPLAHLVCRAADGLGPQDLAGRWAGVRAYTTTTAVWARALLADRYGVELEQIQWLTSEEPHVADVPDPPNVRRDASLTDLVPMLLHGVVDAVIVDPVPEDARVTLVVADADRVWEEWQHETGARTVNHVIVVREALASDAARMRELFRLFAESRDLADVSAGTPLPPIGFDALSRSLEAAITAARAQGLLATPLTVDDLVTSELASLTSFSSRA
jgi:4,5-dihydroxyphthalate decarboxylase